MSPPQGHSADTLDSPQLLLDLDVIDANLRYLQGACRERGVDLRVHFKSLKFPTVKAPAPAAR
jgi:D-serine deaminase-like pyridoxal phosphate-dependent protein